MCLIEDKSIDLILCDLPYGTTQAKWDSVIPLDKLWLQYERIIKENGAIVLFGAEPFSSYLRLSNIKLFRYDWIWHKNKPSGFANAKNQPMRSHETISVFYKKKPTYNPIKEARDVTEASAKRNNYKYTTGEVKSDLHNITGVRKENYEDLRYPTSVQKFNVVVNAKNKLHPAQKPVELLGYLIKTYSNEGELILDNCMGSFTTAIACINTNRNYIGFENDEKYFELGQERVRLHKEGLLVNK